MMRIFCPAFAGSPVQGRSRWPRAKGQQQLHGNAADGLQWVAGMAAVGQQSAHQQRRDTMPSKVEADALQTAAGILPRAMLVSAMADCTVAGKAHKNSMPCTKGGGSEQGPQRLGQPAYQGKHHERGGRNHQMQAPVANTGPDGLAREFAAMQKKEQNNHPGSCFVQNFCKYPSGWCETSYRYRRKQEQGEGVRFANAQKSLKTRRIGKTA